MVTQSKFLSQGNQYEQRNLAMKGEDQILNFHNTTSLQYGAANHPRKIVDQTSQQLSISKQNSADADNSGSMMVSANLKNSKNLSGMGISS